MDTKYKIGIGVGSAIALSAAWWYHRTKQREVLADYLAKSPLYMAVKFMGKVTGTPEAVAAEAMPLYGYKSPEVVMAELAKEYEAMLPVPTSRTGVLPALPQVPPEVAQAAYDQAKSLYMSLPDVPGVDTAPWVKWAMGKK